jgi:cyclopropane fatty-acyl-phospholipid synthase-like methyltransferase
MPQHPFLPAYIFRTYAGSSLLTRLFILIRCWVCPFQALIDFLRHAGPLHSLVDIGCGHGLFLHLALLHLPRLTCYGVDHDPRKIIIARSSRSQGQVTFLTSDEMEGHLPSRVDCISLIDVLYSIPPNQWSQIFALVSRQLKSDGLLIVKETVNRPRWKYTVCLVQEILAIKILKYTKGHFPRLPSVQYYLMQLSLNGFEVISHRRLDRGYLWPHYLFAARKKEARSNIQK